MRNVKIYVPNPSVGQVEYYLSAWDDLENYHFQEDALDRLFLNSVLRIQIYQAFC